MKKEEYNIWNRLRVVEKIEYQSTGEEWARFESLDSTYQFILFTCASRYISGDYPPGTVMDVEIHGFFRDFATSNNVRDEILFQSPYNPDSGYSCIVGKVISPPLTQHRGATTRIVENEILSVEMNDRKDVTTIGDHVVVELYRVKDIRNIEYFGEGL